MPRVAERILEGRARDAEARLSKLGSEKSALDTALADVTIYQPERAAELQRIKARLGVLEQLLQAAEAAWIAAEEAIAG